MKCLAILAVQYVIGVFQTGRISGHSKRLADDFKLIICSTKTRLRGKQVFFQLVVVTGRWKKIDRELRMKSS
jgi:hypothetical protein